MQWCHQGTEPESEDEETQDSDELLNRQKLQAWLLPKTSYFFHHEGDRLHVRHWFPLQIVSLRGAVFYAHGLNGHVNRATLDETCKNLAAQGFAVLTFDLAGNGHSEGLRAYVKDFEHVFQSILHFVALVMNDPEADDDSDLGLSDAVLEQLRALPYFFLGESMGGMLAMYVSNRLYAMDCEWKKRHCGTVLVAPALAVKIPSPLVVWFLQHAVVPLASEQLMPEAVSSSSKPDPALAIRDGDLRVMLELDDQHRFPGVGLGWKQKMRWGTASAFATLYSNIEKDMQEVACPLLVLHDPDDQITSATGSRRLIELAVSKDKTLMDAPNALHDIIANRKDWARGIMHQWLLARV